MAERQCYRATVETTPAEPGSTVVLRATNFPTDTGMPLQVLAGDLWE